MQYQILLAASLAAFAHAQTIVTSSASSVAASTTESQVMPPAATAAFNPAGIDSTTAFNWCHAQLNTCPQICGGSASQNQCDQNAFTYTCVCANGTVPDCTAFIETLPFYICQETYAQCINNHPNDAQGQATCAQNEQCGTRNATAEAIAQTSAAQASSVSSTSSAPASSHSASAASTGSGSSSASATGSSASATGGAAIGVSQQVATGAFAAVLMAVFKLLV
ncbi:hypothetical protein, variant 3 [Cladophialophora immunda]|uniref:DUF7707 domain-containing protein n=1 Tax=Cladophialophora immunda TaxID=569365 RepID=A0A0D2CJU7_9EURO|nr:uncharacterized protein PV07_06131 [Cladophialophora immunda]XP_016250600.1 hypothetical protein, variant 1 [Cladophialophora immunda]XP_016250601.1 hypothetical protein, variant 2 [Cladophialophora immunda]XP_016250602.1 hypothetical protein, variant 3 [Cladophialophora immunda]KIW30383.1 hypothetical protein PV07_06131 [Cladophialophora immunda]KIW30384.1 hypothetical protein, variant 1 [Cladophialophora immunda]KIW30385.1 hypothetical protein, variant 2 [Cladophialophora immunda]KIW303